MKKQVLILIISILTFSISRSQDLGFRTTDIGAEYQWFPHGSIYNLHLAFNSKLNHSIQARGGYNQLQTHMVDGQKEFGSGWSAGLGYRYYFNPYPHQFFLGVRADIWKMRIKVATNPPFDMVGHTEKWILHPAIELGYTLIINDQVYITPHANAGLLTTLSEKGVSVNYGSGFIPQVGISAGFRL